MSPSQKIFETVQALSKKLEGLSIYESFPLLKSSRRSRFVRRKSGITRLSFYLKTSVWVLVRHSSKGTTDRTYSNCENGENASDDVCGSDYDDIIHSASLKHTKALVLVQSSQISLLITSPVAGLIFTGQTRNTRARWQSRATLVRMRVTATISARTHYPSVGGVKLGRKLMSFFLETKIELLFQG